jgi:hypothetical protein
MCCKQREEYIVAKDLSFVHPELRQMAKMFPRLPFRRWNLRLIRWLSKLQPKAKQPDDIQVDNVWIQSQDPGIKFVCGFTDPGRLLCQHPCWFRCMAVIARNGASSFGVKRRKMA